MMNLIIVGAIPPPVGGVRIHTLRLMEQLQKNQVEFQFVNTRESRLGGVLKLLHLMGVKRAVVHYQNNHYLEGALVSLLCKIRGHKMIFTCHSFTLNQKSSVLKKYGFYLCSRFVDTFIAISETMKTNLLDAGIAEKRIRLIDTYVPPSLEEQNAQIPPELWKLRNQTVILASAYKLYLSHGVDLYGLDLCIEVCSQIENVIFLFVVPEIGDFEYLNKCKTRIEELQIQDRFIIYQQYVPLVSLFKICKLFVRPTASDGFGVSVAEALSCGCPAIASDVCDRPVGTVCFRSRDLADLIQKVKETLDMDKMIRPIQPSVFSLQKYLSLYQE